MAAEFEALERKELNRGKQCESDEDEDTDQIDFASMIGAFYISGRTLHTASDTAEWDNFNR